MNYYCQKIIYDCSGAKINSKFILLDCGHILKYEKSILTSPLCGFDRPSHKYYFQCTECKKSSWVDSFGCLGCYTSSPTPMVCDHRKNQPICIGLKKNSNPCKYKSKINNGGYCNVHNNEKRRINQAKIVLNSLPNYCMITDIIEIILKYIIETPIIKK